MTKKIVNSQVVIYQAKSGAIELRGDVSREMIWSTQAQIASVFEAERSVITKHIRNILRDKEVEENSVCAKFAHTAADGKTYQVQYYSLDVILSVGYRTNSVKAIQFRQWATKTLRSYIIDGFAINKNRIAMNYQQFLKAVENVKHLLPAETNIETADVLELISAFADTWLSLDAYDKNLLTTKGVTRKTVALTAGQLVSAFAELKTTLIAKSEASDIFAQERQTGAVESIVGNVMQTFNSQDLYTTVEEKSAHLLYFMVKNHPFIDGNKRCGAFAFVWFLQQAEILDISKLNPAALTALTILVAGSDPKDKNKVVTLILSLINRSSEG